MPDGPAHVLLLLFFAAAAQIAGSFSFGLSDPKALPSTAAYFVRRCGGTPPKSFRLLMLVFPCGALGLVMSWFALLAIPIVFSGMKAS